MIEQNKSYILTNKSTKRQFIVRIMKKGQYTLNIRWPNGFENIRPIESIKSEFLIEEFNHGIIKT
jgi:hypothetical protein